MRATDVVPFRSIILLIVFSVNSTFAASGTWSVDANGNWSLSTNWSGSVVASGSSFTADFGTLNITADRTVSLDAPQTITNVIFGDATTLSNNWVLSGPSALTLTSSTPTITVTNQTATINAVITGSAGLAKSGAGILVLAGTNTYTGTTTINAGSLRPLSTTSLVSTSPVSMLNVAGATLDITGYSNAVGSLTGGGAAGGNVVLGAATLTVGGDNSSPLTYAGVISGTGGITKTGTGTQTFTGANTFTGAVTINSGVLAVGSVAAGGSASALGASPVAASNLVIDGGTLRYTGNTASTNRAFTLGGSGGAIDVSTSGQTLTISGGGSGTGGLTKLGAGGLTLSGSSSYTGTTTISAGSLNAGIATSAFGNNSVVTLANTAGAALNLATFSNTIGSLSGGGINGGNVTITSPAVLTSGGSNANTTYSGVISGTGGIAKEGTGVMTLSGTNTYTGPTGVNNGTLKAGVVTSSFGNNSAVTLANTGGVILDITGFATTIGSLAGGGATGGNVTLGAATLTTGASNASTTYAGVIGGTGGVTKTGTGTFTLTGNNTFTGPFTINAGIVSVGAVANAATASRLGQQAAGSAGLVFTGGTLQYTGNTASTNRGFTLNTGGGIIDVVTSGQSLTISGVGTGSGGLTKIGAGTLTLSAANTFTGDVAVNAGSLNAGVATSAFGNATRITTANIAGASVDLSNLNNTIGSLAGGGTTGGNVNLGSAVLTVGGNNLSTTFGGQITGTGGISKGGTGTLTLSRANTYSGATAVTGGTLRAGIATSAFGTNSPVTLTNNAGVILDLAGNAQTIGSLASTGTTSPAQVILGNAILTTGGLNTATTFSGIISGTGGITKIGSGTFTLSNSNTYTGATTVNGGTLQAGSVTSLFGNNSAITLANVAGVTLSLNNYSMIIGSLAGGGATGGNVSLGSGFLTTGANNTNTTYSGIISGTGGITKTGTGTYTQSGLLNSYTGVTTVQGGILSVPLLANGSAASSIGSAPVASSNLVLDNGTLQYTGASVTSNRGFTLGASGGIIDITTAASVLTLSGIATGAGSLTKSGNATSVLLLSGSNTYTGATNVTGGILRAGSTSAFGGVSPVILSNTAGVVLDLNSNSNSIGSISGGGATGGNLSLGSGTLTLGNDNTTTVYDGVISGTGGIIKSGTGTQTLSRASSFTGSTQLNGGYISIPTIVNGGSASPIGQSSGSAANLVFNGGGLQFTGTTSSSDRAFTLNAGGGTINIATGGQILTLTGAASGSGGLVKSGDGTLQLSGTNTYTGSTTVNAGILLAGSANAFGNNSELILSNTAGAEVQLNDLNVAIGSLAGGGSSGGVVSLGSGTLTCGGNNTSSVYDGTINGTGGIVKAGSGTLTLSGYHTYTGVTTINGGTLSINTLGNGGNPSPLGQSSNDPSNLVVGGGTLQYTGATASTDRGLTLGSSGGSIDVTASNAVLSINGVVAGSTGLTKTGAGTLALTGTNTFGGGVSITNGTLSVVTDAGLGSTANSLSMTNGTTLKAAGTLTASRTINIAPGGSVIIGGNSSPLIVDSKISGNGNLTLAASGNFPTTLANNGNDFTGTLMIGSGGAVFTSVANVNGGISALGAPVTAENGTILLNDNGSAWLLEYTGTGNSSDRNWTISTTGSAPVFRNNGTGTLHLSGTMTTSGANPFTFDASSADIILGGVISGVKPLVFSGTGHSITLSGINLYSGSTTIRSGTLNAGTTVNAFGTSSAVILDNTAGAILNLNSFSNSIGSLSGGGGSGGNVVLGSAYLTTGSDNTNTTFSGSVSGNGGLIKTGTGNFTLSGTNTYTGTTTISNGNLCVTGTLANTATTIAEGALLSGTGTIAGPVIVQGTISPGITSIGNLTLSQSLALGPNAITAINVDKSGSFLTNDTIRGMSSMTFGGTLNVTASGSALAANDFFRIFSFSAHSSIFSSINLPVLSGGLSWNTDSLYTNGTIYVVQPQTITFSALSDRVLGVADFTPGASASSGLVVSYLSSDTLIAKIIGSTIHPVAAGTVTITAIQQGNTQYAPAVPVNRSLTILPNTAPGSFTLLNASGAINGGEAATVNPTFTWNASIDPQGDPVTYTLDIATEGAFTTTVAHISGIAGTSHTITTPISDNTRYYWRITASDPYANSTMAAEPFMLYTSVENAAPSVPLPLLPAVNYVRMPADSLRWTRNDINIGDTLIYNVQLSSTTDFATVTASGNYRLVTGIRLQDLTNFASLQDDRIYYWRVNATDPHGLSSAYSSAGNYIIVNIVNDTPSVPVISAPVNGAPVSASTVIRFLSKDADSLGIGADTLHYQIIVSQTADFGSPVGITDITADTLLAAHLTNFASMADNQRYYWKIAAYDNKSAYSTYTNGNSWFFVKKVNGSLVPPLLSAPSEASFVASYSPTLEWTSAISPDSGVTVTSYTVELCNNNAFSTLLLRQPGLITTNYTVPVSAALKGHQRYYWRIWAFNSRGDSTVSGTFSFYAPNTPPGVSVQVLPLTNTATNRCPFLDWTDATDADSVDQGHLAYTVEIANDASFASCALRRQVNVSEYQVLSSDLLAGTRKYWWRVWTRDGTTDSTSSEILSFTARNAAPNAVTLQVPGPGSSVPLQPQFDWSNGTDPDSADRTFSYALELSTVENFSTLYYRKSPLTQSGFQSDESIGLADQMNYWWRVWVKDPMGDSTVCAARGLFATSAHQAPGLSLPLYPADRTALKRNGSLSWTRRCADPYEKIVYSIRISGDPSFATVLLSKTDIDTTAITLDSLDASGVLKDHRYYYWQIDAIDSYGAHSGYTSGNNIFAINTMNEPPVKPYGLNPFSHVSLGPNGVLRWRCADPDTIGLLRDTLTYTVTISATPSFETPVSITTGIMADSISINNLTGYSSLLNNTTYWWMVQASDNHGATSAFSDSTANFWYHSQIAAPTAPSNLLPAAGATVYPTDYLQWTPSEDSDRYDTVSYVLQIAVNDSFSLITGSDTIRANSYRLNRFPGYSKLKINSTYYYRVKGIDLSGASSSWARSSLLFVSTSSPVPATYYPADDSVLYPTESLRWSSVNDTDAGLFDTLRYIVQLSVKPTFVVVLASDTIKSNKLQIDHFSGYALMADNAHFYWRVSVVDVHGAVSVTGPVHSFILERSNVPPSVPKVLTPSDSGVIRQNDLLSWTTSVDPNVGNGVMYRVIGATDEQFTDTILYTNDISGTAISKDTLNAYNSIIRNNEKNPVIDTAGFHDNQFYYWKVCAVDNHNAASVWSVARRVYINTVIDTPAVPMMLSPTFRRITFPTENLTWQGDTLNIYRDTTLYIVQLSADSLFVNVLSTDTSKGISRINIGSINSVSTIKAECVYWWRVKSVRSDSATNGWSLPASIFYSLKHDAPGTPGGLVPQDSTSTVYPVDILSWNASTTTSPDKLYYEVIINATPTDTTVDTTKVTAYCYGIPGTSVSVNRIEHRYSSLKSGNIYHWRVRTFDEHGYYSQWSVQRSFRYVSTPPGAVTALSPDGGKLINFNDSLTWVSAIDNDCGLKDTLLYEVLIAQQLDFSMVVSRDTVKGLTVKHLRNLKGLDSLKNNVTYYWTVKAIDQHDEVSDRSIVAQFIYNKTNTAPDMPVLLVPEFSKLLLRRSFQSCVWSAKDAENDSMNYRVELSDRVTFLKLLAVIPDWKSQKIRLDEITNYTSIFANDSIYYIRVRATDVRGAVGQWSQPASFRYSRNDHLATIPVIQQPQHNGYAVGTTSLVWNNSTDSDDSLIQYEVTICHDTIDTIIALRDHISQGIGSTTSITLGSIPGNENLERYQFYYWKVGPKSQVDTTWVSGFSSGWNRFVYGDEKITANEQTHIAIIVPGDTASLVARSVDSSVFITFPSSAFAVPTAVRVMMLPTELKNSDTAVASQPDTAVKRLILSVNNANKYAKGDQSLWPVNEPCFSIQTFTLDDSAKPQALLDTVRLFIALHDSDGNGFVDGDSRIPDTALRIFRLNETTDRWELATQIIERNGERSTHLARAAALPSAGRKGITIKTNHFSVYTLLAYHEFTEPFGQFKAYPSPYLPGKDKLPLNISYRLGLNAAIDVCIFSMNGGIVWKKHFDSGDPVYGSAMNSEIRVKWDGCNSKERIVDNGMYLIKLRAKTVNGTEYNVQQYLGVVR